MRYFRWLVGALLSAVAIPFPLHSEEIAGTRFGFGNWEGAAYSNDETGQFSHCVVTANYKSGDTLFLSVTSGATVVIGVSNSTLRFSEGESFSVKILIDRRQPFFARARAVSGDAAFLEIDDFRRAMMAIQRGITMRIESSRLSGVYNLKGTMGALDKALQCARVRMH